MDKCAGHFHFDPSVARSSHYTDPRESKAGRSINPLKIRERQRGDRSARVAFQCQPPVVAWMRRDRRRSSESHALFRRDTRGFLISRGNETDPRHGYRPILIRLQSNERRVLIVLIEERKFHPRDFIGIINSPMWSCCPSTRNMILPRRDNVSLAWIFFNAAGKFRRDNWPDDQLEGVDLFSSSNFQFVCRYVLNEHTRSVSLLRSIFWLEKPRDDSINSSLRGKF